MPSRYYWHVLAIKTLNYIWEVVNTMKVIFRYGDYTLLSKEYQIYSHIQSIFNSDFGMWQIIINFELQFTETKYKSLLNNVCNIHPNINFRWKYKAIGFVFITEIVIFSHSWHDYSDNFQRNQCNIEINYACTIIDMAKWKIKVKDINWISHCNRNLLESKVTWLYSE